MEKLISATPSVGSEAETDSVTLVEVVPSAPPLITRLFAVGIVPSTRRALGREVVLPSGLVNVRSYQPFARPAGMVVVNVLVDTKLAIRLVESLSCRAGVGRKFVPVTVISDV